MEEEKIEFIEIKYLHLDSLNPRLPLSMESKEEPAMLEHIAKETSIEELMCSIGENGYFRGEPLIACKGRKANEYIIVEGNRRLVALKLLNKPSLYKGKKKIAEIAKESAQIPKEAPVIVFDKRDEILDYLGFRHITGVKQWDPLAKARYLLQLLESKTTKKTKPDERYKIVAQSIGSRKDYIKKSLDSLALYNIIEKKKFFRIEGLSETTISFSLIYTAIASPNINDFLKLDEHPIIKIDTLDKVKLEEFTRWLFEKQKNNKTQLEESRNLGKLAYIVAAQKALKAFRSGAPIDKAYRLTKGASKDLMEHLYEAEGNLETANSIIANVKITDLISRTIDSISNLARQLKKLTIQDDD